ncbi:hypothetical protein F2Q69_00011795 [Brassica cretica]|uniref:SWIM-type domain-containing protein n=1 Tax=Brassica cretica TaxID=69181 RepID=A0A8S9QZS1_BRACR|nr:hypothetical protein F2Q69_00011795 [Brassica cretica]
MTGGYEVIQIGENEYEVRNKTGRSFHVNLGSRSCSCFEFQMLAIPCSHAIAAALKAKTATSGGIPMPAIVSDLHLAPPATRRPPGRPKKLRYFSRGEKRVNEMRSPEGYLQQVQGHWPQQSHLQEPNISNKEVEALTKGTFGDGRNRIGWFGGLRR